MILSHAQAKYFAYRAFRPSFRGFGDLAQADIDAVNHALSLMDAALVQAQQIAADANTLTGRAKALITGAQPDALKSEADTFAAAAQSLHDTATKLLADPTTTHDRVVDFVRSVGEVANIKELKDAAARNDLTKMATDVAKQTIADVNTGIPWWVKAGAGVVGAAFVYKTFFK